MNYPDQRARMRGESHICLLSAYLTRSSDRNPKDSRIFSRYLRMLSNAATIRSTLTAAASSDRSSGEVKMTSSKSRRFSRWRCRIRPASRGGSIAGNCHSLPSRGKR